MKFLQNPRLASSPLSTKKAFLKSKGLSDEQINEACAKAGVSSTPQIQPHANYPLIVQNPQTTWLVKLRDAANVLVICGGLAGALWYLWKVNSNQMFFHYFHTQCLKITQNIAFEFFNFGILHQFLSF